ITFIFSSFIVLFLYVVPSLLALLSFSTRRSSDLRTIGRKVAVKELRGPDDPDEASVFQERVLREVRTGGRINDPAVVTVYDVVTVGSTTYIEMELLEAPTLSDLVAQQGAVPSHRVVAIGQQVLSSLRAADDAA